MQTKDLIQAGVEQMISDGQVSYSAWYETLPRTSREVALTVGPGDWVFVHIHEVGHNVWQLSIVNGTQVFQKVIPYRSCHCSADWIVEQPALASGRPVPLVRNVVAPIAKAMAIANGKPATAAQLSPTPIYLLSGRGVTKAEPGPLGADGVSFQVRTL